jgi:hypothetical protein
MKKCLSVALATALAATALVAAIPTSASAATVFGSPCNAVNITDGAIWINTGHGGANPLPVTAPISGVITEWTVNADISVESEGKLSGEFPRLLQPRMVVLQAEGTEAFKVIGEAAGGALNLHGSSTYKSRVPVGAGDYLALAGNPYGAYCETTDPADTFKSAVGGTPVGSTFRVEAASKTLLQAPIVAQIEPDADGDGYGDETQDQCPQSAAYQTACPVVTVSSLSLAHPKAVTVYISSSLSAPVSVDATVNLGKGKTATLAAPAQTVAPGTIIGFDLALPKPVLNTLAKLTKKKALTMSVSASATNVTGSVSTATSTLKLKGQKKPAPRKKPTHKAKKQPPKHPKHQ